MMLALLAACVTPDGLPCAEAVTSYDLEGTLTSRSTSLYDADGSSHTETYHHHADGTVSMRATTTRDAGGRSLTFEEDYGADGTVDYYVTQTYDEYGNVLTYEEDPDADTLRMDKRAYTYSAKFDDDGTIVEKVDEDEDDDGSADERRRYTYADPASLQGNVSTAGRPELLRYEWDGGADGTVDYSVVYSYDAQGNNVAQQVGTWLATYTYDSHDNMLGETVDDDSDGTPDSLDAWTYDDDGNMTLHASDYNADGTIDSTEAYDYDSDGNVLTEGDDHDADGTADWRITYTWDAGGNLLSYVVTEAAEVLSGASYAYSGTCDGN